MLHDEYDDDDDDDDNAADGLILVAGRACWVENLGENVCPGMEV